MHRFATQTVRPRAAPRTGAPKPARGPAQDVGGNVTQPAQTHRRRAAAAAFRADPGARRTRPGATRQNPAAAGPVPVGVPARRPRPVGARA